MTKKTIIAAVAALAAAFAVAAGPGPRGPAFGPRPVHHAYHHHHGAAGFWTGFGIGLVGSLLAPPPPPPAPVIVTAPAVVPAAVPVVTAAPRQVWVPPVYGERPVFRMGVYQYTERYIITPGYWKTVY